jgi:hypothetical protein
MSKYGEVPIAPEHDLNRLAAFVEQRLDGGEREAVVQHLVTCGECREIVAGLAREGVGVSRPEARAGLRTIVWLPIAASLVIAIGAGWMVMSRQTPGGVSPLPEAPKEAPQVQAPPPDVIPPPQRPPDVKRSPTDREISGRRFRLEAGTWIDTGFDPFALLPAVDVRTAADRDALLARLPALKPFLELGPKVTVVHNGTVYRFDLPR